jgi:tetratricopeptide (TPR) repeat protein
MIRVLSAILFTVLMAAPLSAGGVDDLKAANAAAEQGKRDEAIRLFSSAIAAGDLTPEQQVEARKNRASEDTTQSLIHDAFGRGEEARRARDNAIADLSAAIALKADDVDLLVHRGQNYHLNRQYDQAVADYDAALKLNPSPLNHINRAISLRAKGDYDRALADYDAAIASGTKDSDLEIDAIHNDRAYTNFFAARYAAAADDFAKTLAAADKRAGDVLWKPYQVAWLHIARAKAGQNDAEELTRNAEGMDLQQWPGSLIGFYLGKRKLEDVAPPSSHGSMGRARECNLSFFLGEQALLKNDAA